MGWAPDLTKFSESLSEKKGSKGRLFALDNADKLETPAHKWRKRKGGKERARRTKAGEQKNSNGWSHFKFLYDGYEYLEKVFGRKKIYLFEGRGLFGGDVFKNPGRCIFFRLFCILVCFQRQCTCYETVGGELSFPADPGLKTYLQSSVTQAMIKRLLQQIWFR